MTEKGKEPVTGDRRSLEALWANQASIDRQLDVLSADVQCLFEMRREFNLYRERTAPHRLRRREHTPALAKGVRRSVGLDRHWRRNPHLDQEASDSEDDSLMPHELDLTDYEEDDEDFEHNANIHRHRRHQHPLAPARMKRRAPPASSTISPFLPDLPFPHSPPCVTSARDRFHIRKGIHNKPVVVDNYPLLELPLRWRDPPPRYPPLERLMRWPDPSPDRAVRNHPTPVFSDSYPFQHHPPPADMNLRSPPASSTQQYPEPPFSSIVTTAGEIVPKIEAEANSRIKQRQVYETPATGVRSTADEMRGDGGEGAARVGDDLGVINMELVEDPAVPKIEVELNNQKEQSRRGEEIEVLPELNSSHNASEMRLEEHGLFKKLQGVQRSGQDFTVQADPVQRSQTILQNVTEGSDHKFVGPGDLLEGTPVISLGQTNIANEDADVESDNHQKISRDHPSVELLQYVEGLQGNVNFSNTNDQLPSQSSQYDCQVLRMQSILAQENMTNAFNGEGHGLQFNKARILSNATSWEEVNGNEVDGYQGALKIIATLPSNISCQHELEFREPLLDELKSNQKVANVQNKANSQILNCEGTLFLFKEASQNDISFNEKMNGNGHSLVKLASLDLSNIGGDGLKKYNSFSIWISKEIEKVDDPHMKSSSQSYWNFIESEHIDEYGLGRGESLIEVATAVINILGMLPCEGTEVFTNNTRSHTCMLSGLFIGNEKVLVRLSFGIGGPKQVALKLAVISEDEATSDAIHGSMVASDVEIDNLEPKLALGDANALLAPFDALPVPFDEDTWKNFLSAFKIFNIYHLPMTSLVVVELFFCRARLMQCIKRPNPVFRYLLCLHYSSTIFC